MARLRSVALAGLANASQVSGWTIPGRRPAKGDIEIAVAPAEERHVVRTRGSDGPKSESSVANRSESDPLCSNALPGHRHEGRRERPLPKRELNDETFRAADIWRQSGRKPVSAHIAEAVAPGAEVERSISVPNRDRWRFIAVGTIGTGGEQERTHEDRPGQARVRRSMAHCTSTIANPVAFPGSTPMYAAE